MRCRNLITTAVAVSCVLGVVRGAQVELVPGAQVELVPGIPVERDLTGGETHEYVVTLAAGQYAHIVADQRGIDLQLAVLTPNGQALISIDNVSVGPEWVSVLAETGGKYRLRVSPVNEEAARGRYQVRIDELRAATPDDHTRMEAQRLFAEGRRLEALGTAQSYPTALKKLEEALSLWQVIGDQWYQATTLNEIGDVHYATGHPQLALNESQQALALFRELGDVRGEAEASNDLAVVHSWLGDLRQGLVYFRQALALDRAVGDHLNETIALNNIGVTHLGLGQGKEALEYHTQALALSRALGDRRREARSLRNIGSAYSLLDMNRQALEELGHALEIARAIDDRRLIATTLEEVGDVYTGLGDLQEALDCYRQALPLSRETADSAAEARALRNIGVMHRMMGDPRKALEYLSQALAINQATQRSESEAITRGHIGAAYVDLGDKSQALRYYEQALQSDQAAGRAIDEVNRLTQAGPLYAETGEIEKALEYLDQAVTLSRSIRYQPGEAFALRVRARVQRDRGRLTEARADLEAALPLVESTRTAVDRQDLRTWYFASKKRNYYDLYVDVLMRLHETGAAFEASERARARSLLETLVEAHADIRQGSDPALVERERTLQQQINAAERRRLPLLGRKDRGEQAAVVDQELSALLSDYQDVRGRIRAASPRYAVLTQPQPLALKDIQQQVLDEDTLLLEYALGEDHSYLWAVTPASIESFELPRRAEIETAATRAYELLKSRPTREFQRQRERALDSVSQIVLGPVAGLLGQKRLAIVSDGALQYLPFEALPAPGAPTRATKPPLVVEHEIVNLPSASVLAVLRREVAGRRPAAKAVAVLSDPVFEADDPRVRRAHRQPVPPTASADDRGEPDRTDLTRSATESGVGRFERLPFSRQEAEWIERLAPREDVLKAVDFSASKATAMNADIGQFRIVHFATHGLINSQHPELSGIVLSLVDEQGQPQDGFLRAHEIYNLRLNADLVVLSACQTALGKDVTGEGLLSLTRGFMYAGAPRVVASLWDVKDEAAAELMKRFYQGLLTEHRRPAAALRAAQISMWREPRWQMPYYWAAFVIQGEWR